MLKVDNLNTGTTLKILEELKKAEEPLYLWGAGNVADEVYRILEDNGIMISGVFVSGVIKKPITFKNYTVTTLDEVLKKDEKINVFIGHAQYHKKAELEKLKGINKVYYILNPFRTHDDISYDYYKEHEIEFEQAYDLFEEEFSKNVFQAYLNTRINDNLSYLLECFETPMTYFDNDVFALSNNENYVDIGAYNGDTISEFMQNTNQQYEHIYAFEPDNDLFSELEGFIEANQYQDIDIYKLGLWNSNGELFFESDLGQSDRIVDSGNETNTIKVVKLDSVLDGKKVTFIKGALSVGTLEWIEGARDILQNQKPKLVISVGLTKELLYSVPLLLHEINKEYKLYLRFLESMPSRLYLFAY